MIENVVARALNDYCMAWMMRISLIMVFITGALISSAVSAVPANNERWQQYKKQFITSDGRVIDNGNANVSHSEGQGYGMMLAVAANDRVIFEKLWKWTQQHLAIRDDDLFAWRWIPDASPNVPDKNNATDGDIFIAWALGRASEKFDKPEFEKFAKRIASGIRKQLIRQTDFGKQLLPGSRGFEEMDSIVINPSYLLLGAFQELRRWDPSPEWQQIYLSSRKILQQLSKKYNGLLPDWVVIKDGQFTAFEDKPLRFGYDALRVPLYCYWSGDEKILNLARIAKLWENDNAVASYSLDGSAHPTIPLSNAHVAVKKLVNSLVEKGKSSVQQETEPLSSYYYGATVSMLVELAKRERNEVSSPSVHIKHRKQTYVFPDPEIPTLENEIARNKIHSSELLFEQKIQKLLAEGELEDVNNEISQRQKQIANWAPPAWLRVELAHAELGRIVDTVSSNPEQLLRIYVQYPEVFSCHFYYNLWLLADAYYARGNANAVNNIHHQMLSQCRNSNVLLTTLDRVVTAEGEAAALSAMNRVVKIKGVKLAFKELEQRRYNWSTSLAFALRDEKNFKQAAVVLASIEKLVIKRRDQSIARIMAWNYRDLDENKNAIVWFEYAQQWGNDEGDYLNLLQARWLAGESSVVVQQLQEKKLHQVKAQQWAADVLRGEAAKQFDKNSYSSAIALLDMASEYDTPESVSIASLRGWAYYQNSQSSKAYNVFAEAYRRAQTNEEEKSAVNGLLYSTNQSKKWIELMNLADEKPGLLLNDEQERDVVSRLVAGSLSWSKFTVENGRFEALDLAEVDAPAQTQNLVEGVPGFIWGEIRNDFGGRDTVSYLVNQGIDWVILPGDIMLNTFIEYRSIDNDWQLLNEETEGVVGIDFYRKPFHLGVEYTLDHWREDNAGRYYFSWYHDWYKYMRRRNMRDKNWLGVDSYTGSTYGRITREFNGDSRVQGYISQGVDWFTFGDGITLNTSVSYRFRFRNFDNEFYDAHGPSIAVELQKDPFALGMDYSWSISPAGDTTDQVLGVYFRWYYEWD